MFPIQFQPFVMAYLEAPLHEKKKNTGWKGNKYHPFNSRRERLKGPKNVYTIWGLYLVVSSEKVFLVLFCSRRTAYIVGDNAKKITSVGLSYKV